MDDPKQKFTVEVITSTHQKFVVEATSENEAVTLAKGGEGKPVGEVGKSKLARVVEAK